MGRSVAGRVERAGAVEGRLARVARRGSGDRAAREQAGADRHVGDLVQELPDDGQDDAGGVRRAAGAERLREDQVPGGGSRRGTGEERPAASLLAGPSRLRDPETEGERRGQLRPRGGPLYGPPGEG